MERLLSETESQTVKSQNRLALFIDVEGTSKIYSEGEVRFHSAFDQLLRSVCAVGAKGFPEPPLRLFVHQVGGDGLVIVSEFEEAEPERFISIAVILMQVLLVNGLVGKAGISAGTFGDIRGCMSSLREVEAVGDTTYRLGAGLLTTLNVMGTALINSHRFATLPPRGGRLAVDPALLVNKPVDVVISSFGGPVVVDWIHTKTAGMELIIQKTGLSLPPSSELEKRLIAYVGETGSLAASDWGQNTLELNNC